MTNTNCCVYSVETPNDGQQICPKHVEFFITINLRNSASCWRYYEYNKLNKILILRRRRTYVVRIFIGYVWQVMKLTRFVAKDQIIWR